MTIENKSKIRPDYAKLVLAALCGIYLFNCIRTPDDFHLIAAVNLVIHEAGHSIFMFFGEFIHVLGGSLNQALIPAIFAGYFFLRRDLFSCGVVLMWLGESVAEVAHYAADAQVMRLPLLGGDGVIHDWNWLFSATGALGHIPQISGAMYGLGLVVFFAGAAAAFFKAYARPSRDTIVE